MDIYTGYNKNKQSSKYSTVQYSGTDCDMQVHGANTNQQKIQAIMGGEGGQGLGWGDMGKWACRGEGEGGVIWSRVTLHYFSFMFSLSTVL